MRSFKRALGSQLSISTGLSSNQLEKKEAGSAPNVAMSYQKRVIFLRYALAVGHWENSLETWSGSDAS